MAMKTCPRRGRHPDRAMSDVRDQMHNGEPSGFPVVVVNLAEGRSGHAIIEIAGALDQARDASTCLFDHCARDALGARHRRLLSAALAAATGLPSGRLALRRALPGRATAPATSAGRLPC